MFRQKILLTFQMKRTTLVTRLRVKNSLHNNHKMTRGGRTLRVLAPRVLLLSRANKEHRDRIKSVSVTSLLLSHHRLTLTNVMRSGPP